jgi:hypothetical protein
MERRWEITCNNTILRYGLLF